MYLVDLLYNVRKDPKKYEGTKWKQTGGSAMKYEVGLHGLETTQEFEFDSRGDMKYDGYRLITYSSTQVEQITEWKEVSFIEAAESLRKGATIKAVVNRVGNTDGEWLFISENEHSPDLYRNQLSFNFILDCAWYVKDKEICI